MSISLLALAGAACGGADSEGGGGGNVSFGGAQDIGSFRATLERGEIPERGSLDANGFFNEHYNPTPPNNCTGDLCLTPGLSITRDWLAGRKQATLQIAVSTPRDPSEFPRLPMDLAVVVDRSGSMASDDRLEKVKAGLRILVDNLDPADRLTIISFDDVVDPHAPFDMPVGEGSEVRAQLHGKINTLTPRGGTNIYDGLRAGFAAFGDGGNERQQRVILLSDGLATSGITDRGSIIAMAKGHISGGIGVTTIGVGYSFDVELMRGLAENGAGNYYFLEDGTAAAEVFTEELDYFLTPLALDVQLDVTTGLGWQMLSSAGSRIWSNNRSTGTLSIPAAFVASRASQEPGELGRRGGGSMIFVGLEALGNAGTDVADFTLSYRIPGTSERVTQQVSLDYTGDPRATPDEPYLSAEELGERVTMYYTFLGIRAATYARTPECAMAALRATRTAASAANDRSPDPDIAADLELIDMFMGNLTAYWGELPLVESASCDYAVAGEDLYGDNDYQYGCSTSGGGTGWLVVAGVAWVAFRRRRR